MNGPRWSSLGGWVPDPRRPGFLKHSRYDDSYRRTPDGSWWLTADIDRARVVVDEAGRVVRLEIAREALAATSGPQARLEATPEDKAANDQNDVSDPRERFRARLRERARRR